MPHQMPNRSLVSYGTCYLEARLSLHHHPSMKLPFVRGGSRFELHRWAGGFDFLNCQTFAASPAEPGELLFWFSARRIPLSGTTPFRPIIAQIERLMQT